MIRPIKFAGPWKGMISSMSPDQIPPANVSFAQNVFFRTGRLSTAPPIRIEQYAPRAMQWIPDGNDWRSYWGGGRVVDIIAAKAFETAAGVKHTLYLTGDSIYLGGADRAYEVSRDPKTGNHCGYYWGPTTPQVLHYVGEVSEWLIISNGIGPYIWRMNLAHPFVFEQYVPDTGVGFIPLLGGRFMETFANRVVFGAPITPGMDQLHGIGWWGISGPFDNSYPSCGTLSLADVPGNVTGLGLIAEFLAIFKENAIFLGQKTGVLESPIAVPGARITGVGCPYPNTIERIGNGNALVFLSNDNRVTAFDTSTTQPIDDPVRDLIEARDPNSAIGHYDPINDVYMLIYPDLTLEWNTRENWWTTEVQLFPIRAAVDFCVRKRSRAINELSTTEDPSTIDQLGGSIDTLGNARILDVPGFIGDKGTGYRYSDQEVEALVRTAELRIEKPTTLTRLLLRVRAPRGAKISIRHSVDGGSSWYPWQTVTGDDFSGVARVAYDFVDTSEQFTFEFKIVGRDVIIEDAVVDVSMHQQQEGNVTLFTNADFSTSRGTGV